MLTLSLAGSSDVMIDARCLSPAMSVVHGVVLKCPADTSPSPSCSLDADY